MSEDKFSMFPAVSPGNMARDFILHLFTIALYIVLKLLAVLLATAQRFAARLYEIYSEYVALPPSGIHKPEESAIVVIGGENNLGRRICLSFAELGYTVFALCRSNGEADNLQTSISYSTKPAHASSKLLYEWQLRKKQSETSAWGDIAPIVSDLGSAAQRKSAFETVHAYCVGRSLRLVTLILAPPHAPLHWWESPQSHSSQITAADHSQPMRTVITQGDLTQSLLWADRVKHSIMEPILVIRDYVDMLVASSGRLILISGCPEDYLFNTPPSPIDWAYSSIAGCLGHELESLGVRVSSVFVDLLAQRSDGSEQPLLASERLGGKGISANPLGLTGIDNIVAAILAAVLPSSAAQEHEVTDFLVQLVESRYPRRSVSIGVHPFFCAVARATPELLRHLAKLLIDGLR